MRNPNRSKCVPMYKREEVRKLPLVLQAYIRNVFGAYAGSIQVRTRFGRLGAEVGEARKQTVPSAYPSTSGKKCVNSHSCYRRIYGTSLERMPDRSRRVRVSGLGVMPKRLWRVRVSSQMYIRAPTDKDFTLFERDVLRT